MIVPITVSRRAKSCHKLYFGIQSEASNVKEMMEIRELWETFDCCA